MKNSNRSVYQIDMKFDRQLRPAKETSWVVLCDDKTIPKWRTAAILKIEISPYLSEKSYDFDEILYTAADFELDERHVVLVYLSWRSDVTPQIALTDTGFVKMSKNTKFSCLCSILV